MVVPADSVYPNCTRTWARYNIMAPCPCMATTTFSLFPFLLSMGSQASDGPILRSLCLPQKAQFPTFRNNHWHRKELASNDTDLESWTGHRPIPIPSRRSSRLTLVNSGLPWGISNDEELVQEARGHGETAKTLEYPSPPFTPPYTTWRAGAIPRTCEGGHHEGGNRVSVSVPRCR